MSQITTDGSASLQISGGTLAVDLSAALSSLTINGGTLGGAGTVTVAGLTTFSGTMSGTGTTDAKGGLMIRGGTLDGRTLVNEANATLGGANTVLLLTDGAVLDNRAGATLAITDDSSILGIAGQPNDGGMFLNEGIFAKTGGLATGLSGITVKMMQSGAGSTEFQAGRLRFQYDATFTGTGPMTVDAGADVRFQGGTYTFGSPSGIAGAGTVEFLAGTVNDAGSYNVTGATLVSGGDAELTGLVTAIGPSPMILSGTLNLGANSLMPLASLTVSGAFKDNGSLTVTGLTTFNGGSMSGTGTTDAQGGLSAIGGVLDGRTLINEANAILGGANTVLLLTDGAVLDNRAKATFTITDDSSIEGISGQPNNGGMFLNEGAVAKSGGLATGQTQITVPLIQSGSGSIDFQAGRARFQAGATFTGTGLMTVDAGADLRFQGGTFSFASTSGIAGAGTVEFLAGTVNDAGSYNVTGSTLVSVGDAELTGPVLGLGSALTISSGTLNLSGGVPISLGSFSTQDATFAMSGGLLTGSDALSIYGYSSWSGGTMAGTGTTDIDSNIAMGGTAPGVGYNEAIDRRRVNLRFGGTLSGGVGGALYLYDGAVLDNGVGNTDADFAIYNNASVLSLGGTPSGGTFLNEGELDVNYITGTGTCTIAVPLVQSGLGFTLVEGTLRLYGGSSTDQSEIGVGLGATLQFYTGTYNITSQYGIVGTGTIDFHGGTVNDSGPYNVSGLTTVTGGDAELTGAIAPSNGYDIGSLSITSGTLDCGVYEAVTAQTLTQSGGTLTGSINLLAGTIVWTGGTMAGTGTTIAASTLTIGGSVAGTSYSEVLDRRTLENDGVATLSTGNAGGLYLSDGAVLRNANNSFTLLGNVSIIAFGGTPSGGSIVNDGFFNMAGPGKSVVSVPLDNQLGNIHVQSGTLSLTGGLNNALSGTTLANGFYQLEGTLQFPNANIVTNATLLVLDGPGAKIVDGNGLNALRNFAANTGQLTIEGGDNLALAGGLTNSGRLSIIGATTTLSAASDTQSGGTTELDGGSLTSPGGVAVNGGTLQGFGTVVGNVTNASTVQPGNAVVDGVLIASGLLTVSGNYTQAAAGTLDIDLGGTTVGTQYDQLAVSGKATLGGTLALSLVNGWMPGGSDQYSVLTYGSRSGNFATTLGLVEGTVLLSPGFSPSDPSQPGALNLAVTLDSTSGFSISQGGFSFNRFTGLMTQVVTITNTGTTAFIGPISLVLEQLSGATLVSSTGTTTTALDSGNPYVSLIPLGGSLLPGQSLTFKLVFKPTGTISYSLRVLTGLGPR